MLFQQGREEEDGEPEQKKALLEETTEGRHRLVQHTDGSDVCFYNDIFMKLHCYFNSKFLAPLTESFSAS